MEDAWPSLRAGVYYVGQEKPMPAGIAIHFGKNPFESSVTPTCQKLKMNILQLTVVDSLCNLYYNLKTHGTRDKTCVKTETCTTACTLEERLLWDRVVTVVLKLLN